MPVTRKAIAKAPAAKRGRPSKADILSRSRPFKALVKAEENESEDENEGEAIAAEARNTHKRKRDDYNLDGNEPASGSEDEEDQPIQQQEPAGNKPTGSSKRKSAMDLVSGHLDEEMLKRSARDLAHEPIRQAASSKLQSDLVKLEGHKWRFFLTRGGHSLLFYGFGSKLELLERFAREVLTDGIVLAVHGYRPMIKAKHALHAVASIAIPPQGSSSFKGLSSYDLLRMIQSHQSKPSAPHIYLIVHNIDGPGLRSSSDQALLADLSRCPRVHLIASMDHINAPAMWDVGLRARFGFRYQEVTTFNPYLKETIDQPPILVSCSHHNVTRGATTALGSMALNAQAVFRVLAEAQLDDPGSPGITLPTLFRMCRERWLVSSEQALKGFLSEFYDHELVSQRVGGEEQREVLYVPMEEEALRTLLASLKNGAKENNGPAPQ